MCDYSLEGGFRSIDAVEGQKYTLNATMVPGAFMLPPDVPQGQRITVNHICLACVKPGQRLRLTNLQTRRHALPPAIVTVVQRRQNPERFRDFGHYQDGIEFADGVSVPLAALLRADMEVLPIEQERDLDQVLGLDDVKAKVRELVDGD